MLLRRLPLQAVQVRRDGGICRTMALNACSPAVNLPQAQEPPLWLAAVRAALNHGGTKRPKRDRREARRKHVQLATVDQETLAPSVRTVSFRGFLRAEHLLATTEAGSDSDDLPASGGSCILILITDDRAGKVRHIQDGHPQSAVELCWWLDEAAVQFRIAGRGVIADSSTSDPHLQAARQAVWQRLKESTKATFLWPTPGMPRSETQEPCPLTLENAHFAVVLVLPHTVDELRLGGRQKRFIHRSGWDKELLGALPFAELFEMMSHQTWEVEEVNA
ncbi:unnamed protein product [Effrenium voratum]|nr:unnamed protein product [Effrenium voratum]